MCKALQFTQLFDGIGDCTMLHWGGSQDESDPCAFVTMLHLE
jgi:hypothetical protein